MNTRQLLFYVRNKISLLDYEFPLDVIDGNQYIIDIIARMILPKYSTNENINPVIVTGDVVFDAYYYEFCNNDYTPLEINSYLEKLQQRYNNIIKFNDDEYGNVSFLQQTIQTELLKYQLIDISDTTETKYTKLRKIKNDLLNDKNIYQIHEKFGIYEKEYPGFATKCFEKLHYYISYIQTNNIEMYLQYIKNMFGTISHPVLSNVYQLITLDTYFIHNNKMRLLNKHEFVVENYEIPNIQTHSQTINHMVKHNNLITNNNSQEIYEYCEFLHL